MNTILYLQPCQESDYSARWSCCSLGTLLALVEDDSEVCLTINTAKGMCQFNSLVIGIVSAPATWQKPIDQVLQEHSDLIVTEKVIKKILQMVQKHSEEYGLQANCARCEFLKESHCGTHYKCTRLMSVNISFREIKPSPGITSQLKKC